MSYLPNKKYKSFVLTTSVFVSIPLLLALIATHPLQWSVVLFCVATILVMANFLPFGATIDSDSVTIKWLFRRSKLTSANLRSVKKGRTVKGTTYRLVRVRTRHNLPYNLIFDHYDNNKILRNALADIIAHSEAKTIPSKSEVLDWLK